MKPTRQDSLDAIINDRTLRIKKLEDELRAFGLVELVLGQQPTAPGQVVIWTGTEWIPINPPWLEIDGVPTQAGEVVTWNGSAWVPGPGAADLTMYLKLGALPTSVQDNYVPIWNGYKWLPGPLPVQEGEVIALNALNHGVMGDGVFFTGSISSGSNVLNADQSVFVGTDVGKVVSVGSALSTANGDGNTLTAHITTVNSATEVVLDVTADTSASSSGCCFGTDDAPALSTLSQTTPYPIFLPGGHVYTFGQSCIINCPVFGAGADTVVCSLIYQDVFVLDCVNISYAFSPDVRLHDMTICTTLAFYNNINSGSTAYPNLNTDSQFMARIRGGAGNWNVKIPQTQIYNIHTGWGFGVSVAPGYGPFKDHGSGPYCNVNPCYQGICIGATPWRYSYDGGSGSPQENGIAGAHIHDMPIVTQGGHCVFVAGGSNFWHGDCVIGPNIFPYNLGEIYADGTTYFYDPLVQIASSGENVTIDSVVPSQGSQCGHGLVIGGIGVVTNVGNVRVRDSSFQDIFVYLDNGKFSKYPTSTCTSYVEDISIEDCFCEYIHVAPDASYAPDGSISIFAASVSGVTFVAGTKHGLGSVKMRGGRVEGKIEINLDPANVGGQLSTQWPKVTIEDVSVFGEYYTAHALTNNGMIVVDANTQHFRLNGNDVLNGISIASGTSDHYIVSENDCNGIAVSDGGSGTHKFVGNNI